MRPDAHASAWLTPPLVLLGFAAVPALLVYGPRLLSALRARLARSPQLAGIALILTVVVLWTASSVAIQLVFESHRFAKPYFLTYASACLLMVYLPFYPDRLRDLAALAAERSGCSARRRSGGRRHAAQYSPLEAADREAAGAVAASVDDAGDAPLAVPPLGTGESVGVAVRVGALWFVLNLSFNLSLQLSSVSSVTVISATSSIWTLLIGAARARQAPGRLKVAATLLTFFGVLLVMLAGTGPAPVCVGAFSRMGRRLHPCVIEVAAVWDGGCTRMWLRMHPCVTEAATVCHGGCSRI